MAENTSKPVLKYDENGIFKKRYKSEYEACKKNSIDSSSLCKALKNGIKAGGFYWKFDTGEGHLIRIPVKQWCGREVIVYKNKQYLCTCKSIKEASRFTKVPPTTIRMHLDKSLIEKYVYQFEEKNTNK